MKVILVRHGETVENANKIAQGWIQGSLSEEGKEQARKVAEFLKNEKIDKIYSSDLARAKNTAEEIAKFHNLKVIPHKGLREQGKGIYEGQPAGESQKEMEKKGLSWQEFKPAGGESFNEVLKRVSECFEQIVDDNHNKNVLLVSHAGSLSCLMDYLNKGKLGEIREYFHKNTGVTYLEKIDGKWKIIKFNSTEHLQ